jgi:hypothetical protein
MLKVLAAIELMLTHLTAFKTERAGRQGCGLVMPRKNDSSGGGAVVITV